MITLRRKLVPVLDNRITQTRMDDQFNEPNVDHGPAMPDRRKFLVAGLGLSASPLLTHVASGAPSAKTGDAVGMNPVSVRAYGATSAATPLGAMQIERRAIGANRRFRNSQDGTWFSRTVLGA
jgi:hypothetical protein